MVSWIIAGAYSCLMLITRLYKRVSELLKLLQILDVDRRIPACASRGGVETWRAEIECIPL